MIALVWANHQLLIWVRIAPLPGIPSGKTTSKAESRSVAESRSASPRSKISRTLPEAIRGKRSCSIWVTAVLGRAEAISEKVIRPTLWRAGRKRSRTNFRFRDSVSDRGVSADGRRQINQGRAAWVSSAFTKTVAEHRRLETLENH